MRVRAEVHDWLRMYYIPVLRIFLVESAPYHICFSLANIPSHLTIHSKGNPMKQPQTIHILILVRAT